MSSNDTGVYVLGGLGVLLGLAAISKSPGPIQIPTPGTVPSPPTGPAGGALTGTYPNPGLAANINAILLANGTVTNAEFETLFDIDTGMSIQTQLNGKQAALTLPLAVTQGGTGTAVGTMVPTGDDTQSLGDSTHRYRVNSARLLGGLSTMLFQSDVASAASAVCFDFFANALHFNANERLFRVRMTGASGETLSCGINAAGVQTVNTVQLYPLNDNAWDIGASSLRYKHCMIGGVYSNSVATIASAATIAPTGGITHITGSTAIDTITPPNIFSGQTISLIFNAVCTWTAAGNIAVAGTNTTAGTAVDFIYSTVDSKWHPARIA